MATSGQPPPAIKALASELTQWLIDSALPLWGTAGVDPATHAFVEAIARDGVALRLARRARVTPRQVYALTRGSTLGWVTDPKPIVERLNAEIRKILGSAEIKESWAKQGVVPLVMTAPEFGAFIGAEIEYTRHSGG